MKFACSWYSPCSLKEWVVAGGNIRPGRIEDSQLMHTAGSLKRRQKVGKKLLISLSVKDEHGDAMLVMWRTNIAKCVLGDDVLEQGRFPRTCSTENH